MKTKNKLSLLALCLGLSFSAVAQDSVVEQIRLTQDSVRIALNEVENGASAEQGGSIDGDAKVAAFNAANKLVLKKFEEAIRMQVLVPMQMLVNQYNSVIKNTSYPAEMKTQLAENLLSQLTSMAKERQAIYFEIVQRLHINMTNFPMVAKFQTHNICYAGQFLGFETAAQEAIGQYPTWNVERDPGTECSFGGSAANSAIGYTGEFSKILRNSVSQGCYTSTCFFQTINTFVQWTSMVNSILNRDLLITLADGKKLVIKAEYFVANIRKELMATKALAKTMPGKHIPMLFSEMGEDRLSTLKKIEAQLQSPFFKKASNCQKVVSGLRGTLCRTPEGCLSESEKSVLTDRLAGQPLEDQRTLCLAK